MIDSYFKITENFVRLILLDGLCFVHIPFGCMVISHSVAQFTVDLFVSLRVFGLLSSSLLLFPQRFGRYVLRHSLGVCQTREPSRNFRQTREECQRIYRPKRCENSNKDEDNSPKTLTDKKSPSFVSEI